MKRIAGIAAVAALLPLMFLSCASIALSNAQTSLKMGSPVQAVLQAVESLGYDPKNQEAIAFLQSTFPQAVSQQLDAVKRAEAGTSVNRFDIVVQAYQQIHAMNDAIGKLPPLVDGKTKAPVTFPLSYFRDELDAAVAKAAASHYAEGSRLSLAKDMASQRGAYAEFKMALAFVPDYRDAMALAAQAQALGSDRIVVLPFQNNAGLSAGDAAAGLVYDAMIQEMLAERADRTFTQFIDRSQLTALLREQELSANDLFDQATAARIGRLLGATVLVYGQVSAITAPMPVASSNSSVAQAVVQVAVPGSSSTTPTTVTATINTMEWSSTLSVTFSCRAVRIETAELIAATSETVVKQDSWKWLAYQGDSRALSAEQLELATRKARPITQPLDLLGDCAKELALKTANSLMRHFD